MAKLKARPIIFDFKGLKTSKPQKIVENISAVAVAGDFVWTASDELRTLQSFKFDGRDTFHLHADLELDKVVRQALPRPKKEADIEGLAFDGKYLWFCGSHCYARKKIEKGEIEPIIRVDDEPTRSILGRLKLSPDGSWSETKGEILATRGEGLLRNKLRKDPMLSRFLEIPAKENGLDIEGMAIVRDRVVLGLRGPVISARAMLLELELTKDLKLKALRRSFLDLGGFGVRDLFFDGRKLFILAGPTFPTNEPCRIYTLAEGGKPSLLLDDLPAADDNHPEAITLLNLRGKPGLLLLADGSDRAKGLRYTADWYPLPN